MLDLIWTAIFNDNTIINQYDDPKEQKIEHAFKEVLNKQDKLEKFLLVNINTNTSYNLNLKNGTINITLNNQEQLITDDDMLLDKKYKYRLIYFRRVTKDFTPQLVQIGNSKIEYFLGYQYLDENNKNHKHLLKINKDGRLLIS